MPCSKRCKKKSSISSRSSSTSGRSSSTSSTSSSSSTCSSSSSSSSSTSGTSSGPENDISVVSNHHVNLGFALQETQPEQFEHNNRTEYLKRY